MTYYLRLIVRDPVADKKVDWCVLGTQGEHVSLDVGSGGMSMTTRLNAADARQLALMLDAAADEVQGANDPANYEEHTHLQELERGYAADRI